jgi:hypothetical protein
MTNLSPAQKRFLAILADAGAIGDRTPFTGNRDAGRVANAWYRTASVLRRKGLIVLEHEGDALRAWLPQFRTVVL